MRILDRIMQKSARERTKKIEEVEKPLEERKELYKKLAKK